MQRVKVVSALYDIGRDNFDGRSIREYKDWLKKTSQTFPGLIVFHDGILSSKEFPDCQLKLVAFRELITFENRDRLQEVLNTYKPACPNDITFKLIDYSLLQHAKIEFLVRESQDAESLLWVDAGISRFVSKCNLNTLGGSIQDLLSRNVDLVLEVDIRNNIELRHLAIRQAVVGSCTKVISGGAFWVNAKALSTFFDGYQLMLEHWLANEVWDNDQVLIRNMLPIKSLNTLLVPQISGIPGSVVRSLSRRRPKAYQLSNNIVLEMLKRGTL